MLGDNISKIRKSKNMSLTLCAKEIGISPGYLSDIENNIKKNPSMDILTKIAVTLDLDISELLNSEDRLSLISETINQYENSKTNTEELQVEAENNLLLHKIKKLSNKDKKVVEVLINQLLKEE